MYVTHIENRIGRLPWHGWRKMYGWMDWNIPKWESRSKIRMLTKSFPVISLQLWSLTFTCNVSVVLTNYFHKKFMKKTVYPLRTGDAQVPMKSLNLGHHMSWALWSWWMSLIVAETGAHLIGLIGWHLIWMLNNIWIWVRKLVVPSLAHVL